MNCRMCGSYLLCSLEMYAIASLYTIQLLLTAIYYRREKYAIQSFSIRLSASLQFVGLLSKQCCMFKMHANGNKMLLEWYEFIRFNFDTETMQCNARKKNSHTHTRRVSLQSNVAYFGARFIYKFILLDKMRYKKRYGICNNKV